MTMHDRIRAKLVPLAEMAREKGRALLIEHGATDEELAAYEARAEAEWNAWLDTTVADVVRQFSDDAAATGKLQ